MPDFSKHRTPEQETIRDVAGIAAASARSGMSPILVRYFSAVLAKCNYLEYGDPAEYLFRITRVEVPKSPIESIWVPPRFKQQEDAAQDITLDQVLCDQNDCVLILADPGNGKSTLARFLTCFFINRFVDAEQDHFALFIPLPLLQVVGTNEEAVALCAATYVGLENDLALRQYLEREITHATLIFDGLDEVPIGRSASEDSKSVPIRAQVAQLIRSLRWGIGLPKQTQPKMFVTTRSRDYFEDPTSSLGICAHYYMSRFSAPQVAKVVQQWHLLAKERAIQYAQLPLAAELDERRRGIMSVWRENSDLGTICLVPLFLSVLQIVYSDGRDMVSSVSQLCWRAISWFLIEKHYAGTQKTLVTEYREWIIASLVEMGWYSQSQVAAGGSKYLTDQVLRDLTRVVAPEKIRHSDYQTCENAITRIVAFVRKGHGILVNVSEHQFDFAHNIFREVLAGSALRRLPIPERRALAITEQWQVSVRFWAGLCAAEEGGLYEIGAFVGELEEDAQTSIHALFAQAAMLVEVKSIVVERKLTKDLKTRIATVRQHLLSTLARRELTMAQRIQIGDFLSVLGDPRLEQPVMSRMQSIPSAVYRIGRSENHQTRLSKYLSCPASPILEGMLAAFRIGSYLVTNADFKEFVNDSGYKTPQLWPISVAWKWVSGDVSTRSDLIERSRQQAKIHFSSELVGQRLIPDQIPERCAEMINRELPLCWFDPAFNRPNQPVVGINWWEAIAYCLWLELRCKQEGSLKPGDQIGLPTEAEWETAARLCGAGNAYPWITGGPSENSHTRAAVAPGNTPAILRSCGVGLFRATETKLPIFDLVGNAWEWTASKSQLYSEDTFNQVIAIEQGVHDRICRGSSWLSSEEESPQITFRSFDPPFNAYEDLGFRIVLRTVSQ
jgi:formylglycine-generating enzyme required for sulfatase activity